MVRTNLIFIQTYLHMRKLLLSAFCGCICLFGNAQTKHAIDGSLDEWKTATFTTDDETQLSYAMDNDKQSLFIAIKVRPLPMQMKMSRNGMQLFIDVKGKKRESIAINYPATFINASGGERPPMGEDGKPDMKAMQERMAALMGFYKTAGFEDSKEDALLQIAQEGEGILIGGAWDDSSALIIEYAIPFAALGGADKVAGKQIALGWKINAAQASSGNNFSPASTKMSKPGASTKNGNISSGIPNAGPSGGGGRAEFAKEQSVWAKYDVKN
jgi:hypothetical protein